LRKLLIVFRARFNLRIRECIFIFSIRRLADSAVKFGFFASKFLSTSSSIFLLQVIEISLLIAA